ncbi:hypothetical protein N9370_00450 [Paracoccaceae bacterium]|nr:hypothetical protein [Paracoccaceae bacterium]
MRTYNAADIQQLFDEQSHLAQFYVVAHTNICPARLSAKTLHTRVQTAKQDLRHTLNVLAATLHQKQSNLVRRKPNLYRPLALTTIEAVDTAQAATLTTHFNIILGNIPKHFRQAETIDGIFRHTWTNCRQSEDVHTQTIIGSSKGLNFYVLKEAYYDKQKIVGDISTWDIDNTFIPNAAVYAD